MKKLLICGGLLVGLWEAKASATLVAEESFSYPSGAALGGQNGGVGWAGGWSTATTGVTGSFTIAQPPSSEPTGVGTAGNALTIKDGLNAVTRVFRQIDLSPTSPAATAGLVFNAPTIFGSMQPQLGKPGTTIWLGFLSRGHAGSGFSSGSHLFEGVGTGKDSCNNSWTHDFTENDKLGEVLFIGRGGGNVNYGYEQTCGHATACVSTHSKNLCNGNDFQSSTGYNTGVLRWIVARMDFGANLGTSDPTATTVTLWVDPTPSSLDPATSTGTPLFEVGQTNTPPNRTQWVQSAFHFGWVELQSVTLGSEFDEYRIGTSFADITGMGGAVPPDGGTTGGDLGSGGGWDAAPSGDGMSLAGGGMATGCSCRVADSRQPSFGTAAGLLLAAYAALRRRRRSC